MQVRGTGRTTRCPTSRRARRLWLLLVQITHLEDDVSHNAFAAVHRALPQTGEKGNAEDVPATLVSDLGVDIANRNLFGPCTRGA